MEKIMKRLSNLLSVKSLVTLLLTVITFYFGTQSQKAQDAMDAKGDSDGTD